MSVTNLGDLSQSYSMRARNVSLRQEIARLTTELATGQVADVRDVLAGNYSYLTEIERRSNILGGYNVATSEAALYTSTLQTALGRVEEYASSLSLSLQISGNGGQSVTDTALEARTVLDAMVATVNTSVAGRYPFSGSATNARPLADTETMLTAIRAAAVGATTPDDLLTVTRAWFDDPAGFSTILYQGSTESITPFNLTETDKVALDVRAVDPRLREALRLTAVAALADDPRFAFDAESRAELFDKSGRALMAQQNNLIGLQADVGFVEGRIEKITTRNAAEETSLEFAKIALLEIDPYEAATKLEEAQFQLQSLYSLTVRMSQLSLVNFL